MHHWTGERDLRLSKNAGRETVASLLADGRFRRAPMLVRSATGNISGLGTTPRGLLAQGRIQKEPHLLRQA